MTKAERELLIATSKSLLSRLNEHGTNYGKIYIALKEVEREQECHAYDHTKVFVDPNTDWEAKMYHKSKPYRELPNKREWET